MLPKRVSCIRQHVSVNIYVSGYKYPPEHMLPWCKRGFSRGRTPPRETVGAANFHRFFDAKVTAVRASTCDAQMPLFTPVSLDSHLFNFRSLTTSDITAAVRALPDKQSSSDPM